MASLVKRGDFYSIQYYVGGKLRRAATGTTVYQLAREKLRTFESGQYRGDDNCCCRVVRPAGSQRGSSNTGCESTLNGTVWCPVDREYLTELTTAESVRRMRAEL